MSVKNDANGGENRLALRANMLESTLCSGSWLV